ncbi:MAG: HEAT repeat domain-containing protein, partial [Candidatus Riflebacteria bacterium]|nr:HEAT repeat domain-containing protein [Candidatus Riflebacteria bacterium]
MNHSPYELITSNDETLWREGIDELLKEHSEKACVAIVNILSDTSWRKREIAAKSLQNWGEGLSTILEKLVNEQNIDQYYWILNILGHISDEKSVAVLKRGLQNPEPELRSYAVRGLGFKKTIENARLLYPLLNDSNWSIRKLVFEQLLSFDELIFDDLRKIIITPS